MTVCPRHGMSGPAQDKDLPFEPAARRPKYWTAGNGLLNLLPVLRTEMPTLHISSHIPFAKVQQGGCLLLSNTASRRRTFVQGDIEQRKVIYLHHFSNATNLS